MRRSWWQLLLVVPFVGLLWVPFYNSLEPRLGGVPFFYWYQFMWIFLGAGLTAVVYVVTDGASPAPPEPGRNTKAGDDGKRG